MKLIAANMKLQNYGLNTPEILFHFAVTDAPAVVQYNKDLMRAVLERVEKWGTMFQVRSDSTLPKDWNLDGEALWDKLDATVGKEDLVLFKIPKVKRLVHGFAEVGIHKVKLLLGDSYENFNGPWEQVPPDLSRVTSRLWPQRAELDGSSVEFSIYQKSVGALGEPVMFWHIGGQG